MSNYNCLITRNDNNKLPVWNCFLCSPSIDEQNRRHRWINDDATDDYQPIVAAYSPDPSSYTDYY